ncbi:MAG: hypothetical protein NTY01_01935 [Verrucomicrobia bacterium]|nr:hypothetical protein [Verrucomicrobiota bacterium]
MKVSTNTEQKKKAAALFKHYTDLVEMTRVLDSDVKLAAQQCRQNPASPFWHRTYIRCHSAAVEGVLSLLKNFVPKSADYFGVILTDEDKQVATELREYIENGVPKTRPAFLPFRENVKETFKLFVKAHATQVTIQFNDAGFQDLCDMAETRNKLMHPKAPSDLEVSEAAVDTADRGIKWFRSTLEKVLQECRAKLPYASHSWQATPAP